MNTEVAGLLVTLLPFIIGSMVVPAQIILFILLLKSPGQGVLKAALFLTGMTVVRLLQGLVFGLIFVEADADVAGEPEKSGVIVSTLLLVLGILLLVAAFKKWRYEEDPDAPPPRWLTMADTLSPLTAFAVGAGLLLIGPKFWVFTMSALATVADAQLGLQTGAVVYVLFVLVAQSLLLLLLLIRVLVPQRAGSVLDALSAWMTANNRAIVMIVALVFGLMFTYQGITGLLA